MALRAQTPGLEGPGFESQLCVAMNNLQNRKSQASVFTGERLVLDPPPPEGTKAWGCPSPLEEAAQCLWTFSCILQLISQ